MGKEVRWDREGGQKARKGEGRSREREGYMGKHELKEELRKKGLRMKVEEELGMKSLKSKAEKERKNWG